MTDPIVLTALACVTAHLLADFVFQTGWMVAHKHRFPVLLLHAAIVFALTFLLLGGSPLLVAALAFAHLVNDPPNVHAVPGAPPARPGGGGGAGAGVVGGGRGLGE